MLCGITIGVAPNPGSVYIFICGLSNNSMPKAITQRNNMTIKKRTPPKETINEVLEIASG
jgi:hypothetical protein